MNSTNQLNLREGRRLLLKLLVSGVGAPVSTGLTGSLLTKATVGGAVMAAASTGAVATEYGPDRVLHLLNVHTGEEFHAPYWSKGRHIASALENINYVLRDHRANEVMHMDPAVIDYLFLVSNGLSQSKTANEQSGSDHLIQILSGYRSPATNAKLAKKSSGVAKNSLHMSGRAIDFRIPGFKVQHLRDVALTLQRGGIGYYKKSDFVHIDSGSFRHWG